MRFQSKMLRKTAGAAVFVLMESEKPIVPGVNEGTPVAVVTSEQQANLFIGQDAKHRNWYRFGLDELPENVQPVPPPPSPSDRQQRIDQTRKNVEQTTQNVQQFLQDLKNKRR